MMWSVIAGYYAVATIVTFLAFGIDKRRAARQQWRTPERTLDLLCLAGGGVGALAGRRYFRHKTMKLRFWLIPWATLVLHIGVWIAFATVFVVDRTR